MALTVWWTMMEESSSEISSLKPAKLWQLSCYFVIFLTFSSFPTTSSVWLFQLKLTWISLLLNWAPTPRDSRTSHQREKEEEEEEERLLSFCIMEGQEMSVTGVRSSSALMRFGYLSERSRLPLLSRSSNLFLSFYLTGMHLWPGGC